MAASDPTSAFLRFRSTGDPEALASVFDATAAELLRVASHLVADLHTAEDLVQSTFLAALELRERFDPDREVLPWLLGILANHARRQRAVAARRPDPSRANQPRDIRPDDTATELELTRTISDAIEQQPTTYRPVLRLHLRRGLTPQEIALDLGRPPATVRKQLQRGLDRLRCTLPAGVAGIAVVSPAGLATIRANVLARATQLQPAVLTLSGAIVMKKTLTAILVALVILTIWSLEPFSGTPEPDRTTTGDAIAASATTRKEPTPAADEDEVQRAAVAASAAETEPTTPARQTLTVRGIVIAPRGGTPRAGASIFVSRRGSLDVGAVVTTSDANGEFELEDTPIGSWVAAFCDGYSPCELQPVDGDPGSTQDVRLELMWPGTKMSGQVIDPDGAPVAGARIMIGKRAGPGGWMGSKRLTDPPPLWLESDADGRFATASAPRAGAIHVHKSGYAPWTGEQSAAHEVVVRLTYGGVLQGRVLDGTGHPIAGAHVYTGQWQGPPWSTLRGRSDDDGRFRFANVPIGVQKVRAHRAAHRAVDAELEFADGAVNEWFPVLLESPRIHGRVVDEHGAGLEGYRVRADANTMEGPVTTAADGSFEIAGCDEPSYEIRVYHPDDQHGFTLLTLPDFVPNSGKCVIRLRPEDRAVGGILGSLQHDDGRGIGRLEYSLWREPFHGGRNLHTEANTGRFAHESLVVGRYRIVARAEGYAMLEHDFTVAADTTTDLGGIRLERPGTIVVNVTRSGGVPMRRGSLDVIVEEENLISGQVHVVDGTGRSEPLHSGHYVLRGSSRWFPQIVRGVEVSAGQETIVDLALDVRAKRTVRFAHPGAGAELDLELVWSDGTGRELQRAGAAWPASLAAEDTWWFAPGTYRLEATDASGPKGAIEFTIDAASAVEQTLELQLR